MVAINDLGVGMVSLWRVWAALALVLSTSSAVNLKSVQVWAPEISGGAGGVTGQLPGIYAWNAEATSAALPAGVGARAPLSAWTFVGCHRFTGTATAQQADTPVTCTIACEGAEGGGAAAAMQGSSCFCLSQDWERYGSSVEETLCDQPCVAEYFSATTRLCGGSGQHFSVYRKYDFVHQTAQGCYDPWRFIWYQSVAVEHGTYDGSGQRVGSEIQWYLHATSINSGDPLFPYQRRLEQMLLGMQYDLDNSRLVGYTVQSWTVKGQTETWIPTVHTYTVSSQQENSIGFTPQVVPFSFDGSDAAEFLLSTGITALDALHDVYYLTVPQIPEDTGFGLRYDSFRMRLYGINLNAEEDNRVILDVLLDQRIAVLEANSEYHDLFALMLDDDSALESNRFMYVRLGASYRTPREQQVQFNWTFSSPLASVVNPFSYEGFTDKVYQVGSSAVDHVSNTSFLVLKDRPDAEAPFSLADINQRGFTFSQDYSPLESPGVQATWLVNTDPMIPLTLAAPKLISARFAIDGRSILVEFDSFTVQGALPIDNDGDFIPDDIDWSAQHTGLRHCSDIFSRQTAELLGDMPQTACEWLSASTIKIQLSKGFEAVKVGDGLFLKDKTVYAYLAEGNSWSMAASGGIRVGYPEPFDAPEVVVTFVKTVDLCSSVTLDALESYKHGDQPQWTWGLDQVACEDGRSATPDITVWVEEKLAAASVGGTTMTGEHNVTFDKDELEPGCTYTIAVSLTGRWGLTSTKQLTVTKKPIPVPQVLVQNPDLVTTQRASVLTLQSQIEESKCESLLVTRRTLRFEWLAQNEAVNSVTGALETKPVDLGLLVPRIFSASLVVPPLKLQPEVTYRFTVRVGFEETWTDLAQTTSDEVVVTVTRSPIKVSVVGGGREVSKGNPIALDARSSFDPDFPEDLVEDNPAWTFEFQCTTPSGVPCFPVTSPSPPDLPDVRPCKGSTETFKDLGNAYDLPAFSSEVLASDAYYCRDSARNGVLILNVPSTNAFSPGDYIFTVIGSAHGRTASATMTLVVSELVPAPQVVVEPLAQERLVTTQRLRLTGDLIDEDKAQYGDTVAWSWSFFRKETNPLWSQSAATEASNAEVPYLVPRTIFIEATELDPARGAETFLSDPFSSNSLVLRANVLQPSTTYAFRLSATAPAPPGSPGETRVGYAEVEVATAGPPPVPGTLLVEPTGQSYVDEEKLLTAVDWSAEDTPLQYAFSYRTDLQSQFSERVSLRVGPISAPSQRVKCMRAGEASDAFTVELTVTVSSLYGATSELTMAYKVLPPADLALSNQRLLNSAEQTDPQTRALLLGCVDLSAEGRAAAAGEDGSGSSSAAENAVVEQEARKNQADAMMDLLSSAFDIAQITRPVVSTNLKVVQQLAGSGTVTTKMVDFLERTTQEVTSLADSSSSDEERDAIVLNYFNTLGAMGLVAVASSAVAGSLQQRTANVDGAPRTGVYFPSSTAFFSGFERSEWSLVTLPPGAQRRLQAGGGANASSPVWTSLASMYEEQEALERAWRTFVAVTQAQDSYNQLEAARDDEYLANYTAHLGPEEREIVLRAWWEEKARQEAATAAELQLQSGLTRKMMTQIREICAVLVKYMLDGEAPKEFIFPMGAIRLGKSRDLSAAANRSFAFGDPGWKLTSEQEGAYGWQNIKFTQVNPMQWAPDTPRGPFLIDALEVYTQDGTTIPVERQATPITLLGEHSSFAAARCLFWDWQSNNGLGAWETTGVLNSDNGCASTHSGIVGMFLDFASPIVELPSAQESALEHTDERYNREVIIAIAVALVMSAIFHYWAFKQDAVDRLKPVEMRKLGDGISQARTQDDPIYYTPSTALQVAGTFRNLARRDHIVFACLYRCPKLKVTRLQKAAVLFANFCSVAGVAAVFHAEHLVDPRHYVEVGIIVATLTFPMVEALSMMFASRPAHEGAMQEASAGNASVGEAVGPLEAMPVTEDEAEGEPPQGAQEGGPSTAWPAPAALPPLPLLASSHPVAGPETGGGPQLAAPAHVPKAPAAPGTLPPAPPAPPPLPAQAGSSNGPQPGGLPPRAPGPPAPGPPGRPPGGSSAGPPPGGPAQGPGEAWSLQVAAGGPQGGQDAVQELPVVLSGSGGLGPAAAAAQNSQPLALPGGADADLVMPPPEESSSGQAALSQTQRQLLRRVRRMYIERVIQNSERLAYDERVDMRSRIPHPMAHLATVLAHVAVGCFSVVSLALVITYGVHFSARAAKSWAYSCTSGWLFMWLILEVVKITLSTILELSQLNQRRRLHDHPKLKDKVALKKAMKMKQMSAMAHASNVAAPKMLSLVPAPLPDEPPPAMGDASAG